VPDSVASPPVPSTRVQDHDGFGAAAALFGFYLVCMGASAYLYWHGTGKLPWQ
jgi:hypothetical protein